MRNCVFFNFGFSIPKKARALGLLVNRFLCTYYIKCITVSLKNIFS